MKIFTTALATVAILISVATLVFVISWMYAASEPIACNRGDATPEELATIAAQPLIGPLSAKVYALYGVPDPTPEEIEFLASVSTAQPDSPVWPDGTTDDQRLVTRRAAMVGVGGLMETAPHVAEQCEKIIRALKRDSDPKIREHAEFVLSIPIEPEPTIATKDG